MTLGPRVLRADTAAVGGADALAGDARGLAMSFVRPELAARLRRWREPMVWAALLGVGLWLVWRGYARARAAAVRARAALRRAPASGCCGRRCAGCGSAPTRWPRAWW